MIDISLAGPTISVAMSVNNNAAYLPKAIEGVLGATFSDFEFLMFDDGATDTSYAIAEGYAARDAGSRVAAKFVRQAA